ncbi:hypothetical protein [Pantoea sp. OXWO6B1]|uniref:hypothetical protein n=1 Tax=Pantoea sp. OXWO6B1 TaxID=1835724 RepID=UPI0020A349E3|nr:hypothetical protein [Pantoea sp. OXWO6B1]
MLTGDNASGKSPVLPALDPALSISRHRFESLISRQAALAFQAGVRRADSLPRLIADVLRSDTGNLALNGRLNLMQRDEDGLRMHITPVLDKYGQVMMHILEQGSTHFPFEYYALKFMTFSGRPCAGFSRYVHPVLPGSA